MYRLCAFFLMVGMLFTANVQGDPPSNNQATTKQQRREPNPQDLLIDQRNPTDSLAIPLDSSEVEIEEELQTLEKEEKEFSKTGKSH